MRLIKSQTTNARAITGTGIKYDPLTEITSLDGNVMLIPKGSTSARPVGVEGYIRYNTDLMDFEFFQDGVWRLNGYNQPTFISNEVFYSGFDKQDTLFGPLTNIVSEHESMLSPDNTLVFVDQRFNTPHKDYTFLVDPAEIGIGSEVAPSRIRNGENYQIIYPGNTDFTNIGSSDSLVGTPFTANYTTQVLSTVSVANPAVSVTGDKFGYDVAITDENIIVGSPLEMSATGEVNAGSAYIYNSIGSLIQKIVNPRATGDAQDDHFGSSVAINNNWVAIGAWRDDDTLATGNMSGRVYLYNLSAMTGAPTCILTNPDIITGDAEDWFGYDIALSETHLVVGAPKADPAGKSYIYDLNDLVHPAQPKTVLVNPIAGADFGETVAINDVYAIVGAHAQDKVYVFEVGSGDLLFTLDNPNNDSTDMFGISMDMSNDFAIIGAPGYDTLTGNQSGRIYVYDIKGHNPTESLYQITNPNAYVPEDEDHFGYRVAISDGFFMASAHQEDDVGGITDTGRVYTFDIADGELVQSILNPSQYDTGTNDRYGTALAAYGNFAIVGAHEEDNATTSSSGAFYIHNITGKGTGDGLVRRTGTFIKFKEPLNEAAITKIRKEDGSTKIDFDFDVNNLRITLIYLNQKMDIAEAPEGVSFGTSGSSTQPLPDLRHLAPINGSILNEFNVSQLNIGLDWKIRSVGSLLQIMHDGNLVHDYDSADASSTGAAPITVSQINIGVDWKLQISGSELQFLHNGVPVMTVDETGKITSSDDINAEGDIIAEGDIVAEGDIIL
jgi:hypothetical protein